MIGWKDRRLMLMWSRRRALRFRGSGRRSVRRCSGRRCRLKRSGGRRYYRTEDIQLVATIDRLVHREGYTLRGARLAIGGGGRAAGGGAVAEASGISQAAVTLVSALPKAITPAGAQRLRAVRDLLASALAAA